MKALLQAAMPLNHQPSVTTKTGILVPPALLAPPSSANTSYVSPVQSEILERLNNYLTTSNKVIAKNTG